MVNEADMDFRIPGLPHSVVKHAQSTSVRELIRKIEIFNKIYERRSLSSSERTRILQLQEQMVASFK